MKTEEYLKLNFFTPDENGKFIFKTEDDQVNLVRILEDFSEMKVKDETASLRKELEDASEKIQEYQAELWSGEYKTINELKKELETEREFHESEIDLLRDANEKERTKSANLLELLKRWNNLNSIAREHISEDIFIKTNEAISDYEKGGSENEH